jgi:uncharacterized RDD family membrane protein YckC
MDMADITFECPECKQHIVIDAVDAGLQVQCPTCSRSITVPQKSLVTAQAINPDQAMAVGLANYAGLGRRFAAGFVDCVALFIPLGILQAIFGDLEAFFVILVGWVYYSVLLSSSWQSTLGMKLLKINITDKDGGRISFGRASGRYFASLLSALPCFAGFLVIPFTGKKQGLHDMIAGTFVLKNKASQELPPIAASNVTTHAQTSTEQNAVAGLINTIRENVKPVQIVIVCALLLLVVLIVSLSRGINERHQTVEEYVQRLRPVMLAQMNSPNSEMQQLIERIHGPTVTYTGSDIIGLTARTIDGSNLAGKHGNNIAVIDMIVNCRWKGLIQDNGYTEIEFLFDNQAKTMGAPKYIASNAQINLDTVDWGDVALKLGQAYVSYEQLQPQSQPQSQ